MMKLYRLECGLGDYWVVATDPTHAEKQLTEYLNSADYGFREKRKVRAIHVIAEQATDLRFVSGKTLLC